MSHGRWPCRAAARIEGGVGRPVRYGAAGARLAGARRAHERASRRASGARASARLRLHRVDGHSLLGFHPDHSPRHPVALRHEAAGTSPRRRRTPAGQRCARVHQPQGTKRAAKTADRQAGSGGDPQWGVAVHRHRDHHRGGCKGAGRSSRPAHRDESHRGRCRIERAHRFSDHPCRRRGTQTGSGRYR